MDELEEDSLDTHGGGGMTAVHITNFLESIRGKEKLRAPVADARKSQLLCHLGNIAQRTGRTLHCDDATGRIEDDPGAMKLWSREYEPGWEPKA